MTSRTAGPGVLALAALVLLAFVPRLGNPYYLALAISLLQYTVLATAWGMFSGPTRYVSLATTAFFGVVTTRVERRNLSLSSMPREPLAGRIRAP